ncbi:unnamed protein product [Allacma fusca]|uniref:Transposase n=1 Tax=Allacma fusca TaxID=39272 RepID=A0A8J2LBA5_9HEXA|nr:unnamed protein product [Allacma fusca]
MCPTCCGTSFVSLPSRVLKSVSVRRMAPEEISAIVGHAQVNETKNKSTEDCFEQELEKTKRSMLGPLIRCSSPRLSRKRSRILTISSSDSSREPSEEREPNVSDAEPKLDHCINTNEVQSNDLQAFRYLEQDRCFTDDVSSNHPSECSDCEFRPKISARTGSFPAVHGTDVVVIVYNFEVDNVGWSRFVGFADGKDNLLRGWTDFVNEAFAAVNKFCVLVFIKTRFTPTSKESYIYTQGHCKHPKCMHFIMQCKRNNTGSPLKFTARCYGGFFHSEIDIFSRKFQNYRREDVKKRLAHQTPAAVATEIHRDVDMEAILAGNENTRPEQRLFGKMKYELNKEGDNCADPYWDLVEEWTLVQEIPDLEGSTRTYMYALSIASPFKGFAPIAVCEFLTNTHSADNLSDILRGYSKKVKVGRLRNKQLFQRIETDFGLALMYAALDVFGDGVKIKDYLNMCYMELCNQRQPFHVNFHVCRAHMMKTLMLELRVHYPKQSDVVHDLKYLLKKFLTSTTMGKLLFYIRKVMTLCLSENHTMDVDNTLTTIHRTFPVGDNTDSFHSVLLLLPERLVLATKLLFISRHVSELFSKTWPPTSLMTL